MNEQSCPRIQSSSSACTDDQLDSANDKQYTYHSVDVPSRDDHSITLDEDHTPDFITHVPKPSALLHLVRTRPCLSAVSEGGKGQLTHTHCTL